MPLLIEVIYLLGCEIPKESCKLMYDRALGFRCLKKLQL